MCHGTIFEGKSSLSSHSVQATLSAQISAINFHGLMILFFPNRTVEPSTTKAELPSVSLVVAALKKQKVGQNPMRYNQAKLIVTRNNRP